MTAMPIDAGVRRYDATWVAAAPDVAEEGTTRFADLFVRDGETAPAVATDRPEPLPPPGDGTEAVTAQARLFNQDGFFGRAEAVAPTVVSPPDEVAAAPVVIGVAADRTTAPIVSASASPARQWRAAPAAATQAPAHVAAPAAQTPRAPVARVAATPAMASRRVETTEAPVRPAPARFPPTRPMPAPAASVAVAVHAAARGIEIAAQVAGLDESERVRLADEIAALLSAHGYRPAQIYVIAAGARAARQEHR